MNEYLQSHGSGAHAAEARQRLSAMEEQAEKKAWADAFRAGTPAAMNEYLQSHGSGAHAADARRRLSVLEKLERSNEEKAAWADATRTGTAAALREFIQHHESGAHAAEARQRLSALERKARWDEEEKAQSGASLAGNAPATIESPQHQGTVAHEVESRQRVSALEEQPRKEVETLRKPKISARKPKISAINLRSINIRKTCQVASAVSGAALGEGTEDACIKSEQAARDEIVKHRTEFLASERALCTNYNVYLPSYVESLTCLELQRDVRKIRQEQPVSAPPAPNARRQSSKSQLGSETRRCPIVEVQADGSIVSVIAC
jgi:hypothetical protein